MGATEKRRESGAGAAVIGDIGDSGLGGAGRWGVYQDWAIGAESTLTSGCSIARGEQNSSSPYFRVSASG